MRFIKFAKNAALALTVSAAAVATATSAQAETIRIGYWTSGVALGLGAVLEAGPFLKDQGIDATFVKFAEINAPASGLAANVIDLSFSVPAASAFSIAASGVPMKIFAATAPADVVFVAPDDSPAKSLADLRGKKIGSSPAGSSVASMVAVVLAQNYGFKPGDYTPVPGNEARLAQFLVQKQIDAAAVRSVTVSQLTVMKVKRLSSMVDEWHKLTKSNAMPYLGVGGVRTEYLQKNPQAVAKVIVALRNAITWGSTHQNEVAAILQKSANLPAADAQVYAAHWNLLRVPTKRQRR
jgi:NitT/TauT family transport system substrate-binding protein